MKKCPYCAEEIKSEAIFCKHCRTDITKPLNSPVKDGDIGRIIESDNLSDIKNGLSAKQLQLLSMEFTKERRSTGLAYLLWFFLGAIGIHQFYIGDRGRKIPWGALYFISFLSIPISIFVAPQSLSTIPVFVLAFWFLVIRLIIDLFTIPDQVRKANNAIERKIIERIQGRSIAISTEQSFIAKEQSFIAKPIGVPRWLDIGTWDTKKFIIVLSSIIFIVIVLSSIIAYGS